VRMSWSEAEDNANANPSTLGPSPPASWTGRHTMEVPTIPTGAWCALGWCWCGGGVNFCVKALVQCQVGGMYVGVKGPVTPEFINM